MSVIQKGSAVAETTDRKLRLHLCDGNTWNRACGGGLWMGRAAKKRMKENKSTQERKFKSEESKRPGAFPLWTERLLRLRGRGGMVIKKQSLGTVLDTNDAILSIQSLRSNSV